MAKLLSQSHVRLLTLTGPGGSGKTRLSLRVAAKLLEQYGDGVFFVSLAPLSDPALVVSTIATTLGLHVAGSTPPLEVLKIYLQPKQMLLVLDNFEQILAAAPVLNDLLAAAPGVKIIVTSRTLLRISGEHDYLVPPLTLPELSQDASLESLAHSEAVQLFAARASAMQPHFTPTAENIPVVAQICVRLDGLPLAIELAAARINLFSPQALLTRLDSPLRVLTWGVRDLPARQQTLRNTIAWSYQLLNPAEQTIFRRLAVFVGGWTLEAAEAVCAIDNDVDVLNGMQALVDHSLVREYEVNGEPRLTMLETIREYARERLAESGEEEIIRRQHAQFFLTLAEGAKPYWDTYEQVPWLSRLEMDYNNLRAALGWSIERDIEGGLHLEIALGNFWGIRGYDKEGIDWLVKALTQSQTSPLNLESLQAKALYYAADLIMYQNDVLRANTLAEQTLRLCRKIEDSHGLARILHRWGIHLAVHGDLFKARELVEESIALSQQIGDHRELAMALWRQGYILCRERQYEQAQVRTEESLCLAQKIGHIHAAAMATFVLGEIATYQKNYATAQAFYEHSIELCRAIDFMTAPIGYLLSLLGVLAEIQGNDDQAGRYYAESLELSQKRGEEFGIAWRLNGLGRVALHQQRWQAAQERFMESLTLHQKRDDKVGIAACLIGLAGIAETRGGFEQAAQLLGATETLPVLTTAPFKEDLAVQTEYDRLVTTVRSTLGAEAFDAALAAGRALTLEQAVTLASGCETLARPPVFECAQGVPARLHVL